MSQQNVSFTIAGLELTTHEQANWVTPAWLAEAFSKVWEQTEIMVRLAITYFNWMWCNS